MGEVIEDEPVIVLDSLKSERTMSDLKRRSKLELEIIPLIPFLLPILTPEQTFILSAVVTAMAFFGIGMMKGLVLQRSVLRAGLETLLVGGAAAALAYLVGVWLRQTFGVA